MTFVIILSLSFFLFGLLLKSLVKSNLCALCMSISLTWTTLLVYYLLGGFVDPLLLGILMGGSAVGFIYYLASKLPEVYHIFKYPFLLTLVWLIYTLLRRMVIGKEEVILVGFLWVIFVCIFIAYKFNFKEIGQKLIDCCKNW